VPEGLPSGRSSMVSGGAFAPRSQTPDWQSQPQSGYGYGGAARTAPGGSLPGSGGFAGGWAESQMGHSSVGVQPPQSGSRSAAPPATGMSMPVADGGFGGGWAASQMGGSSGGVGASPSMAGRAGAGAGAGSGTAGSSGSSRSAGRDKSPENLRNVFYPPNDEKYKYWDRLGKEWCTQSEYSDMGGNWPTYSFGSRFCSITAEERQKRRNSYDRTS
jgi:hypothetical protein